jgi:hypothetical protein
MVSHFQWLPVLLRCKRSSKSHRGLVGLKKAVYTQRQRWIGLPGLVNIQKTMENLHFLIGKSTINGTVWLFNIWKIAHL